MRVVLFEAENDIREELSQKLRSMGFEVVTVTESKEFLFTLERFLPEVCLMDPSTLSPLGLGTIKKMKERGPLNETMIMVTARDLQDMIRFEALEIGADDFMAKPYRIEEMALRIKALGRRSPKSYKRQANFVVAGDVEIDLESYKARRNGRIIPLTLTEYKLLVEILKNKNNVVTREHIRNRVLVGTNVTNRTIDVHMASLRKKMGEIGDQILTIRGVGYRYSPQVGGSITPSVGNISVTAGSMIQQSL